MIASPGDRPDGLTLIPWQKGQSLTWDVTVAATLADSWRRHLQPALQLRWRRAEHYAKYAALPGSYLFQPIALETLGSINESAVQF